MKDTSMRVLVAGHRGMVGSAVVRRLQAGGYENVLTAGRDRLDCTRQTMVDEYFAAERPDAVIIAAAKVGGIHANNEYPATFAYDNMMIQANLIEAAHRHDVQRLIFLGSSCIYPKLAEQPMREDALLTGSLELTNEPYAIAKIAGIKLCESYNRQHGRDYRSLMPTNLYGPGDNFHPENSHVIPGLMQRFHQAKAEQAEAVTVWGTGNAMREFLHVDDLADAVAFVLELDKARYDASTEEQLSHVNVGTGVDVTIRELAETMKQVVGFEGELRFDTDKPDGTPRKLLDTQLINGLGWSAATTLGEGLAETYAWYLANQSDIRA